MEAIENPTHHRPVAAATAPPAPHQECDQCGAAIDATQRYCVWCGAHRRHVDDPATRYLMTTTARTRAGAGAGEAGRQSGRRSPTLGLALALALIPVVAAVGVSIGRSSGSGDDKLLAALRAQKPQVVNVAGGSDLGGGLAGGKSQAAAGPTPKEGGQVLAKTSYGVAHQISGFKVTAAQLNSGRQIVQKIQQTQGKNYVAAQRGLPDPVSVP